jgi:hypothetical protein
MAQGQNRTVPRNELVVGEAGKMGRHGRDTRSGKGDPHTRAIRVAIGIFRHATGRKEKEGQQEYQTHRGLRNGAGACGDER